MDGKVEVKEFNSIKNIGKFRSPQRQKPRENSF